MKPNDKVSIISSPYESIFGVGSEHIIKKIDFDCIYLTDPNAPMVADENVDYALWPFYKKELRVVE